MRSHNLSRKNGKAYYYIIAITLLISSALFSPQPVSAQSDGFPLGWQELLPVHISAMALAGMSLIIGGLIARYRKGKSKKWLRQHKTFQWSGTIFAVIGVATSIVMVEVTFGTHLNAPHSIIALVSLCLILLAIVVAYGFLKRKKHKKELRVMHRWIGRFTILAWLVTILFGFFAAGIL